MVGMWVLAGTRTYSVACAAGRVRRGPMTTKLARMSSLPANKCCSDTGWPSAGLTPMITTVLELRIALSLLAMGCAIDGAFSAGVLADTPPVRARRRDGAPDRAVRADVLADRDRSAGRWRRPGRGLAHRAERQCAERRQAAGRETGAAQKTAAIEAAVRLALQRCGEPAPLRLMMRPLDQHGCLPSVTVAPVERRDIFGA